MAAEEASLAQELLYFVPEWAGLPVENVILYESTTREDSPFVDTSTASASGNGTAGASSDSKASKAPSSCKTLSLLVLCSEALLTIHTLRSRMKHPRVGWALRLASVTGTVLENGASIKPEFRLTCAGKRAAVLEKLGKNLRRWQKRYVR
jgi:hypothetical protein